MRKSPGKIASGYDEPILLTNFQQGTQPAHLFEIPKDYKGATTSAEPIKKEMEKPQNAQEMEKQLMNQKK